MEKVDILDLKILQIISVNARIPFKDVAQVCGVSRAAIHQRVQRLIESGVITGSGYHVYPKHIGYSTCTYVGIKLERGSMYKNVSAELEKIPEIIECHFTTGPYTMLVKLYSRDNEHLMDLLNNRIQGIPGVISTETLISLEQSINREVPIILPDGNGEVCASAFCADGDGELCEGEGAGEEPDGSCAASRQGRRKTAKR